MPRLTSRAPAPADLLVTRIPDATARAVVSCDLSALGLTPLRLTVALDHSIQVERPAAARVRGVRLIDFRPAHTYVWEGGMPHPSKVSVPDRAPYTSEDFAVSDPVAAVLLRALGAHAPLDAATVRDALSTGRAVWGTMWAHARQALEPRAFALSHRFGYHAPVYALLAQHAAICDAVERFPVLGPFVTAERATAWPEGGASPRALFGHVFPEARTLAPSAGVTAWMAGLPITDAACLPMMGRSADAKRAGQRAVVIALLAAEIPVRPEKVASMKSPEAWCLAHTALVTPGCVGLVPVILENAEAAVNAVRRGYQGQQWPEAFAEAASATLIAVRDWMHAAPDVFQRAQGFARMVRESDQWHRGCAVTDRDVYVARDAADRAAAEAARLAAEAREAEAAAARVARGDVVVKGNVTPFAHAPRFVRIATLDVVATWLSCPDALAQESALAHHCIGTSNYYAAAAMKGEQWHFTIRTPFNDFLATTTITAATGELVHCLGPKNTRVAPSVRRFAEQIGHALLGQGALPAHAQTEAFTPPVVPEVPLEAEAA